MEVQMRVPRFPLSQFVQVIWLVRGQLFYRREKVIPDGTMELILNFGPPYRVYEDDPEQQTPRFYQTRKAWIVGTQEEYLMIEPEGRTDLMGFRFHPGGAYPFFGFPMDELRYRIVDLDLILGPWVDQIREQLAERPDPDTKLDLFETLLWERMKEHTHMDPLIRYAVGYLSKPANLAEPNSVRRLARELGYSEKHTQRLVTRHVGVSPKKLHRIFRFQNLLQALQAPDSAKSWADVAQCLGFYDQAHLTREFRMFTGITPTAYRQTQIFDPKFIPTY